MQTVAIRLGPKLELNGNASWRVQRLNMVLGNFVKIKYRDPHFVPALGMEFTLADLRNLAIMMTDLC